MIEPRHIGAIERAIRDNEARAQKLLEAGDYNAEFPEEDAKSLREVLLMLSLIPGYQR